MCQQSNLKKAYLQIKKSWHISDDLPFDVPSPDEEAKSTFNIIKNAYFNFNDLLITTNISLQAYLVKEGKLKRH